MSDSIIRVEKLGKLYRIGQRETRPRTWSEAALGLVASPFRYLRQALRPPTEDETLWALSDVSFEVAQGEVVGIVGRNGAGKSTLLKILSRITEPTTGRATLKGRVGSLLEVGTGFHPELTGRENVYLNGAILGMKKREIDRKFDEIVAFAEIDRFIDTPVKRYSSGMSVRLAFAVAAHLEPEILIVDEVLAVGDAAFQRKCLGKMEDVSQHGRTVLFVSHNMPSVQALCQRAVLLEGGRVTQIGSPECVLTRYLDSELSPETATVDLAFHPQRVTPPETALLRQLRLLNTFGEPTKQFQMGETIIFELSLDLGTRVLREPLIVVAIERRGVRVCNLPTHYMVNEPFSLTGRVLVRCTWDPAWLVPASYSVANLIVKDYAGGNRLDAVEQVTSFEILPRDVHGTGKIAPADTILVPRGHWDFMPLDVQVN